MLRDRRRRRRCGRPAPRPWRLVAPSTRPGGATAPTPPPSRSRRTVSSTLVPSGLGARELRRSTAGDGGRATGRARRDGAAASRPGRAGQGQRQADDQGDAHRGGGRRQPASPRGRRAALPPAAPARGVVLARAAGAAGRRAPVAADARSASREPFFCPGHDVSPRSRASAARPRAAVDLTVPGLMRGRRRSPPRTGRGSSGARGPRAAAGAAGPARRGPAAVLGQDDLALGRGQRLVVVAARRGGRALARRAMPRRRSADRQPFSTAART